MIHTHLGSHLVKFIGLKMDECNNHISVTNKYNHGSNSNLLEITSNSGKYLNKVSHKTVC